MEYSTIGRDQAISAEGVIFDRGSVYDRLHKLTDLRKAKGKRYSLVTVLMITLLAKLCGANTPMEIAEWGENHKEEIVRLLKLKRLRMPEQSTYRRIMAHKVYMEEIERLGEQMTNTSQKHRHELRRELKNLYDLITEKLGDRMAAVAKQQRQPDEVTDNKKSKSNLPSVEVSISPPHIDPSSP